MAESIFESEAPVDTRGDDRGALAVIADDFSALEDRVRRAVELVKRERAARTAADRQAADAEAKVLAQAAQVEHLQSELSSLRAERDQVRQRVERLLAQLDALEL